MAFGKADIGLIKATAGAEKAQFIDDNLMMGAAIGGAVNTLVTQYTKNQEKKARQAKALDKAFNESYKVPGGSLDPQMEQFLAEKVEEHKSTFLNNQGGSFEEKRNLAKSQREFEQFVASLSDAQGVVDNNSTSTFIPAGMDADDQVLAGKLKNKQYQPGSKLNASGNGYDFYFAIPKNETNEPTLDPNVLKKIKELEAAPGVMSQGNQDLLEELKIQRDDFNVELNEWKKINRLPDKITVDGVETHNPAKYDIMNPNEAAKFGGVEESRTNILGYITQETGNFTKDSHFDVMKSPAAFSAELKKRLEQGDKNGQGKIDTRTELNDILFSDGTPDDNVMVNIAFNDDGSVNEDEPEMVENSYANMFIHELADPVKHSYMYKDENGEDIRWETNEGTLVYGSKDWDATPKDERRALLDMKLRGKDELGVTQGVASFDEHQINQYSKFMGTVLSDQREAQKRTHYEKSGLYFDDGTPDSNPYAIAENKSLNIREREQLVYNKKQTTYTNSIIDLAFGNDKTAMFTNRIGTKDGVEQIEKVLKAEFKAAGMDLDIKSPGKSIEINGEEFDFSDLENSKQTLKDLKQYILDLQNDEDADNALMNTTFLTGKPNSAKDWEKEFDTKNLNIILLQEENQIFYLEMTFHLRHKAFKFLRTIYQLNNKI